MRYSIKRNRWEKAALHGMEIGGDGRIMCSSAEGIKYFILPLLDSGVEDCQWGRICIDLKMEENCVFYLYAAAANDRETLHILTEEKTGIQEKKKYLGGMPYVRFVNQPDVLLYGTEGRYLWIAGEIIGDGVTISNMTVQAPGDNFMQVFPEVYREKGSFFHRYLSIYSSLYNDFQRQIDHRECLFDMDTGPAGLLELYMRWIGIDVEGGFLEEGVLRRLLREAGSLLRRKGTRESIARICSIVVGEMPVIAERSMMQRYIKGSEQTVWNELYGSSLYDVTLLFPGRVKERKKQQLLYLLEQFKPIRSRLRIIFLEKKSVLDGHSYMDMNAAIVTLSHGRLDGEKTINGTIMVNKSNR